MLSSIRNLVVLGHAASVTLFISIAVMLKRDRLSAADDLLEWWSRSLLNFIGLDYKVHNLYNFEFEKNKPYIVMCNHASLYDIPLSFMAVKGRMRMLTKKELFKVPIWGRAMKMAGFVSIDRHNRRQAIEDLKRAKKLMEGGVILWIAPEGSRSRDGGLLPFKKGGFRLAIETGSTVVPLVIRGNHEILPARTLRLNSKKQVGIYIGKPIEASAYRIENRDKLLEDIRAEILSLMN